ncbi:MAG: prepilin-type N-terminal cleavage/methylation domain-containing protein [Candidatus Margulisiibacteriota bacterium]
MNNQVKNLTGFTLIELLVSVAIITIMSGLFMVNYHGTNKRSELNIVKQKLASDIRLAQNYSLGSKTYDGVTTPSGGWGIHFDLTDPTHYIIFADLNENMVYDGSDIPETKTLPAGVTIDSLSVSGFSETAVDIVFLPPNPITYINTINNATADIVLKENVNNSTAMVSVNFFGLIDTD